MLNKKNIFAFAAIAVLATLSACSGDESTKADPNTKTDNGGINTAPTTGYTGGGTQTSGPDLSAHSVYFDFDKSEIKADSLTVVANWAKWLSANPTAKVRLEGNTDERGTREYNIGLGERRANAVAQALQSRGVSASQLNTVSYGKERPVALGHDEASWGQNRRVDLVQQ